MSPIGKVPENSTQTRKGRSEFHYKIQKGLGGACRRRNHKAKAKKRLLNKIKNRKKHDEQKMTRAGGWFVGSFVFPAEKVGGND